MTENPRENDLLLVGVDNIAKCIEFIGSCGGIVIDSSEFSDLNDAEIEGLIVSLTSRIPESSVVMV